MNKLIISLAAIGILTLSAKLHGGECYRALDQTNGDPIEIIVEDLLEVKQFYFTQNQCTHELMDTAFISNFRFIYVPVEEPASMLSSSGGMITDEMREYIAKAKPGFRILIEGLEYKFEGEEVANPIPPLVYHIVK